MRSPALRCIVVSSAPATVGPPSLGATRTREVPLPTVSRRSRPVAVAALLGLLVATSAALRHGGFSAWYWIDEALTIGLAGDGLAELPERLRADGSPPLYYAALALWTAVFGRGELATHLLSGLLAVTAVPVGFFAGRRVFGERAGWMTAGLCGLSPFLSHFSGETRMYTLAALLSVLVAATFVQGVVRDDRRSLVAFALSLSALTYTHNWGLYTAVAAAAAMIPAVLANDERRRTLVRGVGALSAVGVAYVPWSVVLLRQIGDTGAPWAYTPRAREVVWEVAALVRDERVLLLLAVVVGGALLQGFLRPTTEAGAIAWSLLLFCTVPVGLGWIVSTVEPSWATRYLAVVVGPMLLLAGWGLARAGSIGNLALLVTLGLWLQPVARLDGELHQPLYAKSDGKLVAQQLDEQLARGDLVIVAQPEAVPLFDLYMEEEVRFATLYGGVLEEPMVMDWRRAPDKLRAADVELHLLPLLEDLGPGARVALVGPGGRIARTDTEWIRTFHRKHGSWLRTMRGDPALEPVRVIDPDLTPVGVPFEARVFEVGRASPTRE